MSLSEEPLRLVGQLRAEIGREVDDQTRRLVQAWAQAWDDVVAAWSAAADAAAAAVDGDSFAVLHRLDRARAAVEATARRLDALFAEHHIVVRNAAGRIVSATSEFEPLIIATQLPTPADTTIARAAVRFDKADPQALDRIVTRTLEQVTSLNWPLTPELTQAMNRELTAGTALGRSPRDVAARILTATEGRFTGGLARALTISRTELLDAYRDASRTYHQANSDVLAGWVWVATLDRATCPSCWAMHGTEHPVDEAGPLDHQQGRCARAAKTKSWAELGFTGITERPSAVPDARARFNNLPAADQLAIMGPARLDALRSGRADWTDLSTVRTSAGWRDSVVPTPVAALA